MKIFLNPGHGGTDPGAVSKTGTKEADITAKIADILYNRLKLNGYPVEIYQQKKYLTEVSQMENKSGATCFISIHCNSFNADTAHGTEVLYYPTSNKGKTLATIMQEQLVKTTGLANRGIKARTDLHVLKATKAPAILIETAFISNTKEECLLKNSPELFASAIWEGIKIFNQKGLI
jgi:N-acetylmuramoyl-L-alanine amidase